MMAPARQRGKTLQPSRAVQPDSPPAFLLRLTKGPQMLKEFLQQNEDAILALTEEKTLELAGDHPSSDLLKRGLPSFYRQIIEVLDAHDSSAAPPAKDVGAIARAADRDDEPAMAIAAGQPRDAELARSA